MILSGIFTRALYHPSMDDGHEQPHVGETGPAAFATTQWSLVLSAGHDSTPDARTALEQLCRSYWYPLYAYLRRSGQDEEDAKDLIQSFFATLLEHDWLAIADPAKGRFRSFLLVCLKRFVSGEAEKARALKRGGGTRILSLDDANAAERYALESTEGMAADVVYDRRWAITLLEQAWDRLREECEATGRLQLFEHLKATQDQEGGREVQSYGVLAQNLKMSETALKSAMFRLRARFRELLRHEVVQTVSDPKDVNDEIRYLLKVLSN
jgi:DNA-directed RNA polymerase specialized sigma24 family protein